MPVRLVVFAGSYCAENAWWAVAAFVPTSIMPATDAILDIFSLKFTLLYRLSPAHLAVCNYRCLTWFEADPYNL
jgi:hypothetical protein